MPIVTCGACKGKASQSEWIGNRLEAGAHTLAQDEETCVVYGMPREAVKRGAVEKTVTLDHIGREIAAFAA